MMRMNIIILSKRFLLSARSLSTTTTTTTTNALRTSTRQHSIMSRSSLSWCLSTCSSSSTFTTTRSATTASSPTTTTVSLARLQLLQASLQHVPEYGWTQDAIRAGLIMKQQTSPSEHDNDSDNNNNNNSEEVQQKVQQQPPLPLSMMGMITPTDLVEWFMKDSNQKFAKQLDAMKCKKEEGITTSENDTTSTTTTTTNMNVSDVLYRAIRARLEYILPVGPKKWHMGMALGAVENPQTTAMQIQEIVDLICHKIYENQNTTSTSSSASASASVWQRSTIGAIYVATELHLLSDESPNYEATWTFLKQRIHDCNSMLLPASSSESSSFSSSSNNNNNHIVTDSTALMAMSSVVTSLAGAVMSVAQPPKGQYMISSVLLPQFLSMTTLSKPNMTTDTTNANANTSTNTVGTSPQDYYSNLPPFPSDKKS